MKTILALAIIMLTINQVFTCDGYKSGKSCLYTGAIDHCKVYAAPKGIDTATTHQILCATCEEFWELDEDGNCQPKEANIALNGLAYMDTVADYAKLIDVVAYRGQTLDYTKVSCVIAGQIVPFCASGYYFKSDDFKCTACTATNCESCDAITPATCLICNAGYVLQADGTCSACGAGALKCTDSANHTECLPGFFLNDKLCATCGTGSNALTCVSATEHKTCEVSYKLDATTKLCVTCGDNIESCTASSITQCGNSADNTKYNYITAADDACVGHLITNNCLTIEGTTTIKCATCIENYYMSNGVCEHWSTWVDGTLDAANKSVVTITPGTSSAAVSAIACSSAGWYKDTTNLICVKCYAGCATCSDYTSSTARLDECLTADTTVNTMYMSSNTPTTCVASNVATCSSATEILSCTADTHALLYTYAGTTAGVYDGAITKSCTGVSNGVGGVADATCAHAYVNGATGTGLPNKKCSKCISTAATLVLTYASAIGTGDITYTCAATSTTDTQEKYGCTQYKIVSTTANTTQCESCVATHYLNTTTHRCILAANCTQMSQTENKCTTCDSNFALVNGACVAEIDNCKTYNATTTTNCDECEAGFAWTSATVKTTCTNPTIANCELKNPNMKTLKDCLICKMGYQWDATTMTCKACTEEGVTCVSTGCETFAPSDDKETPPADNSTIIVFVLTTLVALMSLLI